MGDITAAGTIGFFSGLVLFGLVVAALAIVLEPLFRDRDLIVARAIVWLLGIAIAKFALLPSFPGYWDDVRAWNLWSSAMAYTGPSRIYEPQFACDYPPGYLYVLWLCGYVAGALGLQSFDAIRLVTGTPPLVADFFLGLVIFAAIRRLGPRRSAFAGMLLFALNPALLFDTLVWGQSDSVLALPILISALLIVDDHYEMAWAMAALAVLIKPQGLVMLPVLAAWTLLGGRLGDLAASAAAFAGTLMIGLAPFQIDRPWNFLFSIYWSGAGRYPTTSDNAFNLLGTLAGLRQPDSTPILGVPAFALGMALFIAALAFAAWILYRSRTPRTLMLSLLISFLAMFVFAPRIHERYLYPALVLAIPIAFDSVAMMSLFIALSATFLFNLAWVKRFHEHHMMLPAHSALATAAALVNLAALAIAGFHAMACTGLSLLPRLGEGLDEGPTEKIPNPPAVRR